MVDAYAELLVDLTDEQQALDDVVAAIATDDWEVPTPAEGWAVRDQIWHLTYFDGQALRSATDPDGFTAGLADLMADPVGWEAQIVAEGRRPSAGDLLAAWRNGRSALHRALVDLDPKARMPWYGPPMSAMSFATARLMETWAHGQDVVDGLAAADRPSSRADRSAAAHRSSRCADSEGSRTPCTGGRLPRARFGSNSPHHRAPRGVGATRRRTTASPAPQSTSASP